MTGTNGNGVWRTIAVGLGSVCVTLAGSWFAFGCGTVSRDEVVKMIATQTPYAQDREYVHTMLTQSNLLNQQLLAEITALKVEQARTATALDALTKAFSDHAHGK